MNTLDKDAIVTVHSLQELEAALIAGKPVITTPDYSIYYMGFGYIQAMAEVLSGRYPDIYDRFALNIADHYALYSRILKSQFKKVIIASDKNKKIVEQVRSILSPREVYTMNTNFQKD